MKLLLALHHGLHAIGKSIGQITRLALVFLLITVPLFAVIFGSFVAAVEIGVWTGASDLVWIPLFFVLAGLTCFYVPPHAQPQISKAIMALIEENKREEASA